MATAICSCGNLDYFIAISQVVPDDPYDGLNRPILLLIAGSVFREQIWAPKTSSPTARSNCWTGNSCCVRLHGCKLREKPSRSWYMSPWHGQRTSPTSSANLRRCAGKSSSIVKPGGSETASPQSMKRSRRLGRPSLQSSIETPATSTSWSVRLMVFADKLCSVKNECLASTLGLCFYADYNRLPCWMRYEHD